MKIKFYPLVLLFFSLLPCSAISQNINTSANFPDTNFRTYVEQYMGVSSGGEFTAAEAAAKTGDFNCSSLNISDLTGIEYFTSITYLDCSSNQLTELDVSNNTALESLYCGYNQLTEFLNVSSNTALTELICWTSQVTKLNLTNNTLLQKLVINNNQLTELDVSKNIDLSELNCGANQLTELDVSNNTALTVLWCWNNNLTELDVSDNTLLLELKCNHTQLTKLNLSKSTVLCSLDCRNTQLAELDVSNNSDLWYLNCEDNQLTELDLSNNGFLMYLNCKDNQLTELDLSLNTFLNSLYCDENQLAELDLTENTSLNDLYCSNNQLQDIASFLSLNSLKKADIRYNNLDSDDWSNVQTLIDRIGEPAYNEIDILQSGCAYSPQNNYDPYDFGYLSTPTPTTQPIYTPVPTNTPTPIITNTPASAPTNTPTPTPSTSPTTVPTTAATNTPVTVGQEKVLVFDNSGDTNGDMTGTTDFDSIDNRNLTIYCNGDQTDATDWHVYVRKGFGGVKYLGRTGSGSDTSLEWYSGAPRLSSEFSNGPDFNSAYTFRMVRIDNSLGPDDFFDMTGLVGFNLEGGNDISLSQPDLPYLDEEEIVVYDDILGGKNIAPVGGIGTDNDKSVWRAIQIAWNFGVDRSIVNEYHIYISVNDEDFVPLGQTLIGSINYFWWTPNEEFKTSEAFIDGPQNGNTYQFKVFLLPLSDQGSIQSMTSGKLMYVVE